MEDVMMLHMHAWRRGRHQSPPVSNPCRTMTRNMCVRSLSFRGGLHVTPRRVVAMHMHFASSSSVGKGRFASASVIVINLMLQRRRAVLPHDTMSWTQHSALLLETTSCGRVDHFHVASIVHVSSLKNTST
eukprot:TRINITY_DN21725_c0_g1_i1.p1 TRINITY_DN21725_c0_g1~~TRINITY_DN21725_c0_g1_i1.p1  ORF type:complete len:145 (+),score=10.57 TRINITY_DN21725_c0_g1_i1:43-435(+)